MIPKLSGNPSSPTTPVKTVENTANLMDRLHDYTFDEADMQASINTFRSLFKEMLEVSSSRFDKKTLEAMWIFFVLKRLLVASMSSVLFNSRLGRKQ
ncbi:hypothetical protein H4Q26_009722 [Puccinia striiformis f. sp. tritici PST-130]|nr:hypothetical protein H4Q26_009722 [Puccinia striiformis f. sp. tritici PST-130]